MTAIADRQEKYRQLGLWTDERIGWLLSSSAQRWGDREFINLDGARYSFAELDRWATVAAHDLVARGVRSGDRVMLQLGNCIELLVLHFAAWRIGAVSVPVIPIYRTHEVSAIVAETKPVLIATMRSSGTRRPYAEIDTILATSGHQPRAKLLIGAGESVTGWAELCGPPPAGQAISQAGLPDPALPDTCCIILFTSGTTAAPKGVMLSSRGILANIMTWRHTLSLSADDVSFSGAPLAHVGTLVSAVLVALALGARTVIMAAWNPDLAVEQISAERATFMSGAAVFLRDMVERYEKGAAPGHRLKVFVSGGAPTPPILVERAEKQGMYTVRCFGLSEMAGPATLTALGSDLHSRAYSDGQLAFGVEIEIVDDERRPLPFGENGNIRLRAPQLMLGYFDPAVNAAAMDGEGWFYPGDMGIITADHWLTVTGRTKDIINRGGEKFSSQDIESVLSSFPDIRVAAVVGVPDARFGEAVGAFLILREGARWNGPEAVLAHLEKMDMTKQKFPVEWHILDEFPSTASGKIQKQKLLEWRAAKVSAASTTPAKD